MATVWKLFRNLWVLWVILFLLAAGGAWTIYQQQHELPATTPEATEDLRDPLPDLLSEDIGFALRAGEVENYRDNMRQIAEVYDQLPEVIQNAADDCGAEWAQFGHIFDRAYVNILCIYVLPSDGTATSVLTYNGMQQNAYHMVDENMLYDYTELSVVRYQDPETEVYYRIGWPFYPGTYPHLGTQDYVFTRANDMVSDELYYLREQAESFSRYLNIYIGVLDIRDTTFGFETYYDGQYYYLGASPFQYGSLRNIADSCDDPEWFQGLICRSSHPLEIGSFEPFTCAYGQIAFIREEGYPGCISGEIPEGATLWDSRFVAPDGTLLPTATP